jgi:hypothetical protein
MGDHQSRFPKVSDVRRCVGDLSPEELAHNDVVALERIENSLRAFMWSLLAPETPKSIGAHHDPVPTVDYIEAKVNRAPATTADRWRRHVNDAARAMLPALLNARRALREARERALALGVDQ